MDKTFPAPKYNRFSTFSHNFILSLTPSNYCLYITYQSAIMKMPLLVHSLHLYAKTIISILFVAYVPVTYGSTEKRIKSTWMRNAWQVY
jgi:hypothetical protein